MFNARVEVDRKQCVRIAWPAWIDGPTKFGEIVPLVLALSISLGSPASASAAEDGPGALSGPGVGSSTNHFRSTFPVTLSEGTNNQFQPSVAQPYVAPAVVAAARIGVNLLKPGTKSVVDLSKFKQLKGSPNRQGPKNSQLRKVHDQNSHRGSKWKLYEGNKRIASLDKDGKVVSG